MSKNSAAKRPSRPRKKTDRRVTRTRDRLGDALIALIQEKPFDSVTVADVLARAGVSRSTFYVHYSDKDDLFMSDVEEFIGHFANLLITRGEKSDRVAPVAEFFDHVRTAGTLYRALVSSGRINDFLDLARGHFARAIERRLKSNPRTIALTRAQRTAMAAVYSGGLVALLQQWIDTGMKQSPAAMDAIFHRMVWAGAAVEKAR